MSGQLPSPAAGPGSWQPETPPRRGARRLEILLVLGAVSLGGALMLRIAPYQMDDAFIAFRYAANLAAGHGPTYNPGEPPAEGFTSPLWVGLLAGVSIIGGAERVPVSAGVFGILAYATCVVLAFRAGSAAPRGGVVAASLIALLPPAVFYAVTGLEAVLFTAAVLAYAAAAAGVLPLAGGCAAGALAMWVRPEGAWLPVMHAAFLLGSGRAGDLFARRARWLVGSVVVGGAALLALRLSIFGAWIPNTYWAKPAEAASGLLYLKLHFSQPWCALVGASGLLGGILGRPVHRGYLAAAASWLVAVAIEGADWMPVGRFLLPALVLLALAASGLATPARAIRWRQTLAWSGAAVWLLALGTGIVQDWRLGTDYRAGFDGIRHEARLLAGWVSGSGARSAAAVDIGELGWRTRAQITDLAGLTDAHIGRAPGTYLDKRFDLAYVLEEQAPEVLIVRVRRSPAGDRRGGLAPEPELALSGIERRLLADPRLDDLYVPLFVVVPEEPRHPFYGKLVYARRDAERVLAARPSMNVVRVRPLEVSRLE